MIQTPEPEFVQAIVPTITTLLGVVVGFSLEFWRTSRQRQADASQRKNAIAQSLVLKIFDQYSWYLALAEQSLKPVEPLKEAEGFNLEKLDGLSGQDLLGLVYPPLIGFQFELEEKCLVLETGDQGLLEEVRATFMQGVIVARRARELEKRLDALRIFLSDNAVISTAGGAQENGFGIPQDLDGQHRLLTYFIESAALSLSAEMKKDIPSLKGLLRRVQTSLASIDGVSTPKVEFKDG